MEYLDKDGLQYYHGKLGVWEDISSNVTYESSKVTSGSFKFLYNRAIKMVFISGNATVNLSSGKNTIGTIATAYRANQYYTALTAVWDQNAPIQCVARIYNRTKIEITVNAAYTGNIGLGGLYVPVL